MRAGRRRFASLFVALGLCVALLVAGASPASAKIRRPRSSREWPARVQPIARAVERIRGQKFDHPVPVHFLGDRAFEEVFGASGLTGYERRQLRREERLERPLGLVGPAEDLVAAIDDSGAGGVAGFFDGFEPRAVAAYGPEKVEALLADPGIVRNRLKVRAAIGNASRFLEVQEEFGTFDAFVWRFVGDRPRKNGWRALAEIPARTPESDALSAELKRRGFRFVGSTICYAFMQAAGLVNDHLVECFRYPQVAAGPAWPAGRSPARSAARREPS